MEMANSAASPQEKFEAAVRVIQSLPKNGSFQPSHEMMLRFYALYKQAKFGSCSDPKPAFWDVVRKAKWDAWKKLENVSSESAMIMYVEELKKVIETMPHTPDVSAFLEKLGSFYELVDEDDLQDAVPDTSDGQSMRIRDSIKLAASKMSRSRGNSDSASSGDDAYQSIRQRSNASARRPQPGMMSNGRPAVPINGRISNGPATDSSDLEGAEVRRGGAISPSEPSSERNYGDIMRGNGDYHHRGYNEDDEDEDDGEDEDDDEDDEFCDVASSHSLASAPFANASIENGMNVNGAAMESSSSGLSQQIINSLTRLEHDVHALSSRLDAMDHLLRSRLGDSSMSSHLLRRGGDGGDSGRPPQRPWWWRLPFDRLALRNVVLILVWPLIVQVVGRFVVRRLRARTLRRVRALPH